MQVCLKIPDILSMLLRNANHIQALTFTDLNILQKSQISYINRKFKARIIFISILLFEIKTIIKLSTMCIRHLASGRNSFNNSYLRKCERMQVGTYVYGNSFRGRDYANLHPHKLLKSTLIFRTTVICIALQWINWFNERTVCLCLLKTFIKIQYG